MEVLDQIESCCQTLCNKQTVIDHIVEQELQFNLLEKNHEELQVKYNAAKVECFLSKIIAWMALMSCAIIFIVMYKIY
jgi:hypothetical protein